MGASHSTDAAAMPEAPGAGREEVMLDALDDVGDEHKTVYTALSEAEQAFNGSREPALAATEQLASELDKLRLSVQRFAVSVAAMYETPNAKTSLPFFRATRPRVAVLAKSIEPRAASVINMAGPTRRALDEHATSALGLRQCMHDVQAIRRGHMVRARQNQRRNRTAVDVTRAGAVGVLMLAPVSWPAAAVVGGVSMAGRVGAEVEARRTTRRLNGLAQRCTTLLTVSNAVNNVIRTLVTLPDMVARMQYNLVHVMAYDQLPQPDKNDDKVTDDMMLQLERLAASHWLHEMASSADELAHMIRVLLAALPTLTAET